MMRLLTLIICCLAGPASAECVTGLTYTFQVLPDGSIWSDNLFPLTADAEIVTYAACPVVLVDGNYDVTDCRIGVTDRDGGVISYEPLGTCTAEHGSSLDCPTFEAEGFTWNNRNALENVIAAEGIICSDETRPRPLAQQVERDDDRGIEDYRTDYFEVVSRCGDFTGTARDICDALPVSHAPLFAFEATSRTTVCTLKDGNQLAICHSN